MKIDNNLFIPHHMDDRVLLDLDGEPRYLYFPEDKAIHVIKAVVLNRETLHEKFDMIRETTKGSVFFKKSRMIPSQQR